MFFGVGFKKDMDKFKVYLYNNKWLFYSLFIVSWKNNVMIKKDL